MIEELVDEIVTVEDTTVEEAMNLLLEIEKVVVEGAGAAGIAALLQHPDRLAGREVGVVLSGGNIDPRLLASVIFRADGRRGRDLKALWPELLARPCAPRDPRRTGARDRAGTRAWPIPTRYDPDRLANGRVLFVGDAAGVVDPMTGEGIAQALETGVLAAESIAAGGDPGVIAARYVRTVSRERSDATCASRRPCKRCCATRSARVPRSRRPGSRRGPGATSPAGCSRTTRVRRS